MESAVNRQVKIAEGEAPVDMNKIPGESARQHSSGRANVIDWRPDGRLLPEGEGGKADAGAAAAHRSKDNAVGDRKGSGEQGAQLHLTDNFDPALIDCLAIPAFVIKVLPENRFAVLHINASHAAMTGLKLDDIRELPLEAWLPEAVARDMSEIYRYCIKTRQPYTCDEIRSLPGGDRHWKTSLSPISDSSGQITYIIGTATEFTREARAHSEAVQKHKQILTKYQEYRDNFSTAAHDLRSPICQLDAVIKLLSFHQEGQEKKECQELLSASQHLIENLLQHLDAVLRKSQPDGPGEEGYMRIELNELCSDILSMLDPMGKTAHDFQKVSVVTEKTLLQVVLRNLIDNAIKHNAEKQSLQISVTARQIGHNLLKFTVKDNGSGLSADNCSRGAILPQASNGRIDTPHGLATIKRMILAQNGDLQIANSEQGLVVNFILHGQLIADPAR